MIPIAKGKFSKPRNIKRDPDTFEEILPADPAPVPAEESIPSEQDNSPTMLVPPVLPEETMSFEEAQFIEETADFDSRESDDLDEYDEIAKRKTVNAIRARNRKILLVSICVVTLLLLVAIIAGILMFAGSGKDDGLILNNVTIAGVNVGGMTPEQAVEAVHRATDMTYTVENMVIRLPDTILELSPADTGAKLDVEAAVQAAFDYGRTGTWGENRRARQSSYNSVHTIALLPYLNLDLDYIRGVLDDYGAYFNSEFEESSWKVEGEKPALGPDDFDPNAECQALILNPGKPGRYLDIDKVYDDVLDAFSLNIFVVETSMTGEEKTPETLDLEAIYQELYSEPVNATMDMETFEVSQETYGYGFDLEKTQELLSQTEYGNTIAVPMEYIRPEVCGEDLEENLFRDVLASYETKHTQDANRNHNLKLACEAINGMILMPGDLFDYNVALGERTTEAGYKPAGALSAGVSTVEVGGGICQVSSTLYYCTLIADLEIVERRSHSLVSTYMPIWGTDATVSWGGPEFRFRNNTNYPIRIEAEVADGYVKIRLVGTDEKDYYVQMQYAIVDSEQPETEYKVYETEADAAAAGHKDGQVLEPGVVGYTVYTYKCKYDKETDKLISRTFEAVSNYVCRNKVVVKVNSLETEPTEPPTEGTTPPGTEGEGTTPPEGGSDTPPENQGTTPPPAVDPPAEEPPVTEPDADGISEGGETP